MNILFDFITTYRITGASEYVRRVFFSLLNTIEKKHRTDVHIIAAYDSKRGNQAYPDLAFDILSQRAISYIDIHGKSLLQIVNDLHIDKIFIGCAQFWGRYRDLDKLDCEILCVIHDLSYEEKSQNFIDLWMQMYRSNLHFAWNWGKSMLRGAPSLGLMKPFRLLMERNNKFRIIAVSEYTKNTLKYQFDFNEFHIVTLYSPERIYQNQASHIENTALGDIIARKKKYFLALHGNRPMKNVEKVIRAFGRYVEEHNDVFILTTGMTEKRCKNHIALPFLSESDLANAYAHCWAFVYPSLFEGFGYPPIEAMHYGKPVLSSNVCSMPEVLGDAPIYFSPFYDSDIYRAMCCLNENNYESYSKKSMAQYLLVKERQEADLNKLIKRLVR